MRTAVAQLHRGGDGRQVGGKPRLMARPDDSGEDERTSRQGQRGAH